VTQLPAGYNYPIVVQVKSDPRVFSSTEYQQRSSFAPTRTTSLNYLGLGKQGVDALLAMIDAAGAVDKFDWLFRPHYAGKKWLVESSRVILHDENRLEEVSIELREYPAVGQLAPATIPALPFIPDQAPVVSRRSRIISPQLGYFFDRKRQPVNALTESIQMNTTLDYDGADEIDQLLDKHRGVYPLLWRDNHYVCSDWQITYSSEFAEVELTLNTFYGAEFRRN
jgi:phage-related protein